MRDEKRCLCLCRPSAHGQCLAQHVVGRRACGRRRIRRRARRRAERARSAPRCDPVPRGTSTRSRRSSLPDLDRAPRRGRVRQAAARGHARRRRSEARPVRRPGVHAPAALDRDPRRAARRQGRARATAAPDDHAASAASSVRRLAPLLVAGKPCCLLERSRGGAVGVLRDAQQRRRARAHPPHRRRAPRPRAPDAMRVSRDRLRRQLPRGHDEALVGTTRSRSDMRRPGAADGRTRIDRRRSSRCPSPRIRRVPLR